VRDRDAPRRGRLVKNCFFDLRKKAKLNFAKNSIRQILRKLNSAIQKMQISFAKRAKDRRRMER
jgi:hypothetical protein